MGHAMSSDEDHQATPDQFIKASDDEVTASFGIPAPFVNKVVLTLTPITGRITFLEIPPAGRSPVARTAVTMGINDLFELRNLIDRMLAGKTQAFSVGQEQADG